MIEEQDAKRQIAHIEAQIAELTARLPRHSVPPALLIQLEELEDKLSVLKSRVHPESASHETE